MANKLELLQKLLIDREEVIMLHRGKAHCSCGVSIEDFSDIENHLVHAHDKLSSNSSRKCLQVVLKDIVNRLSDQEQQNLSEQQLDIEIPKVEIKGLRVSLLALLRGCASLIILKGMGRICCAFSWCIQANFHRK